MDKSVRPDQSVGRSNILLAVHGTGNGSRARRTGGRRGTDRPDLERLRRSLHADFPLIGAWRRSKALAQLDSWKEDPVVIPLLLELADSHLEELSTASRVMLCSLKSTAAVDALCERAIEAPAGTAATICKQTGRRPSDPEHACLFLFVTRQLDAYFQEDFEFQNLRLEYDQASPEIRAQVMSVLRSGDSRCLGFFGSRKKLSHCNDREVMLALQSFRRHGDHSRLFQAFLELPLKYGLPILAELDRARWEPAQPEHRSLLKKALEERKAFTYPPPRGDPEPGELLNRWLEEGRDDGFSDRSEEDLLGLLEDGTLPEKVVAVGALASRPALSFTTAEAIENNPHWIVRLAGFVSGFFADFSRDEVRDPSFWVNTCGPRVPVLEFRPQKGSPAHLENLRAAPPEAWQGALGAARRILCLLLAHRITAGSFDEMVIEADAFAATFELVDEAPQPVDPSANRRSP